MATVSTADSHIHLGLEACVSASRRIEYYQLEPGLQNRLLDLGERKEFLDQGEYDELMALVDFAGKRTIDSLEARFALDRDHLAVSELDLSRA